MLDWPYPLDLLTVRTVSFGLAALGAVAGTLGTFAVVRRQSLQGDAISHAAIPGVAIAFLLGGREPLALVVGAAVAGWIAMALVGLIVGGRRIPFDAALAGTLAVFFGFGIVLMTYLQRLGDRDPANAFDRLIRPAAKAATNYGLEKYLFGETAFLSQGEGWLIVALGGSAVVLLGVFWKEFQLVSFDRDFASSLGYPSRALDLLLTTLVVIAVVIGLRAVGVVLMSTMLIAPAVAARQWTDRLGRMTLLAAGFGALAGFGGVVACHLLNEVFRNVPTGPTVVLLATSFVGISLLLAPKSGLIWELFRNRDVGIPGDLPRS